MRPSTLQPTVQAASSSSAMIRGGDGRAALLRRGETTPTPIEESFGKQLGPASSKRVGVSGAGLSPTRRRSASVTFVRIPTGAGSLTGAPRTTAPLRPADLGLCSDTARSRQHRASNSLGALAGAAVHGRPMPAGGVVVVDDDSDDDDDAVPEGEAVYDWCALDTAEGLTQRGKAAPGGGGSSSGVAVVLGSTLPPVSKAGEIAAPFHRPPAIRCAWVI